MADVNRINPDRPHIYPTAIHIVAARIDAANEPDVFHYGQPPINDDLIVRSTFHHKRHFDIIAEHDKFYGCVDQHPRGEPVDLTVDIDRDDLFHRAVAALAAERGEVSLFDLIAISEAIASTKLDS